MRMFAKSLLLIAVASFASLGCAICQAQEATQSQDTFITADGKVSIHGVALLPDGTPAAGADVAMRATRSGESIYRATTDDEGRFRYPDVPSFGLQIQAATADREWIGQVTLSDFRLRTEASQPVSIPLVRSVKVPVVVTANGTPVAGAQVTRSNAMFDVIDTDENGFAEIKILDNPRLKPEWTYLSAFHSELGIGGNVPTAFGVPTVIELFEPKPKKIRLIDGQGQPVPNVDFVIDSLSVGNAQQRKYFVGTEIKQAQLNSGPTGVVECPWFPVEGASFPNVVIASLNWVVDTVEFDSEADGEVIVHLSPLALVKGKVTLPVGEDARGLFVSADGTKQGIGRSHWPTARCASDGSFEFRVAAGYTYAVGVMDNHWASDLRNGMILPQPGDKPEEIKLEAYRATPITISATHGPQKSTLPNCFVNLFRSNNYVLRWKDADESSFVASCAPHYSCNGMGEQTVFVGRGEFELRFSAVDWSETRRITVDSDTPQVIEFHRPWVGARTITADLRLDGQPAKLSESTIVRGWTGESTYDRENFAGELTGDDQAQLTTLASYLTLAVVYPVNKLSGSLKIDEESPLNLTIDLQPAARLSGTVTSNGAPLKDYEVRLAFAHNGDFGYRAVSERTFVPDVTTDAAGGFEFPAIPSDVVIGIFVREKEGQWQRIRETHLCSLLPGENRTGVNVELNPTRPAPAVLNAQQRADALLRDSRLNRLPALLVLTGPDAPQAADVTSKLLDHDAFPEILNFLVRRFSPQDVNNIAFNRRNWIKPGVGQFSLIAVSPDGNTAGQVSFTASSETAVDDCKTFVRELVPAQRSGREQLAAALDEAGKTNRNVWLILGGSRCGPCFLLARWIDDHRELLEKDFVILKLVGPVDEEVYDLYEEYCEKPHGIPWTVMLKPDGSKIADSDGPLGNIGFPSDLEGRRHFRNMLRKGAKRATDEQLDALMQTLRQ